MIGNTMEQFEAIPKKWGNSLGITIPSDIAEQENIQPQKKITVLVIGNKQKQLKKMFGTLKLKKPTQQVMDEIDEGYDKH
ncbi:MAG TPA: AbrB/MazE/SpoVT family DNA-binding domain-containing protein [Candidatus Nanoarchaeia archaeon]|nr:AbrB/MazE/SpoVT family DNA-binding domain-containing protein [Candidatus Nanoarchaeia archaeon]